PGAGATAYAAAEGDDEVRDPGAVLALVDGQVEILARPHDPDQVLYVAGRVFTAAHADHEVLVLDAAARAAPQHWAAGSAPVALAQTIAETVVAVLLILGLATRKAALLGLLLSINLALTVAYLVGPDTAFRWMYYLAVLVNAQLFFSEAGIPALGRLGFVPAWLKD